MLAGADITLSPAHELCSLAAGNELIETYRPSISPVTRLMTSQFVTDQDAISARKQRSIERTARRHVQWPRYNVVLQFKLEMDL